MCASCTEELGHGRAVGLCISGSPRERRCCGARVCVRDVWAAGWCARLCESAAALYGAAARPVADCALQLQNVRQWFAPPPRGKVPAQARARHRLRCRRGVVAPGVADLVAFTCRSMVRKICRSLCVFRRHRKGKCDALSVYAHNGERRQETACLCSLTYAVIIDAARAGALALDTGLCTCDV